MLRKIWNAIWYRYLWSRLVLVDEVSPPPLRLATQEEVQRQARRFEQRQVFWRSRR